MLWVLDESKEAGKTDHVYEKAVCNLLNTITAKQGHHLLGSRGECAWSFQERMTEGEMGSQQSLAAVLSHEMEAGGCEMEF